MPNPAPQRTGSGAAVFGRATLGGWIYIIVNALTSLVDRRSYEVSILVSVVFALASCSTAFVILIYGICEQQRMGYP